eukprot:scaffold10737_cov133-Isochrysis_galbana.AAC.1
MSRAHERAPRPCRTRGARRAFLALFRLSHCIATLLHAKRTRDALWPRAAPSQGVIRGAAASTVRLVHCCPALRRRTDIKPEQFVADLFDATTRHTCPIL